MNQAEILLREDKNHDFIYLYLEGSFYKAYERSAFVFHSRIKEFRILRKESKSLCRDILYLGFPQTVLERLTSNLLLSALDDKTLCAKLQLPIDENEYLQWRDAQEIAIASRSLITQYTKVIDKTPVFKLSYEILTRISQLSANLSKNYQVPFGIRMKELSFDSCCRIRELYDFEGIQRDELALATIKDYDKLSFLLQFLKDTKQISLNSFALLSESIQSVSKQLLYLRRKAKADVDVD